MLHVTHRWLARATAVLTLVTPLAFLSPRSLAAHRAALTTGGSIVVARSGDFQPLDPATAIDYESFRVMNELFSGLMGIAPNNTLYPDLAASLPTVSNGGRAYTFHLRPGLRFADGTPLTANDVAFSINRAADPKIGSWGVGILSDIAGYDAVEAGKTKTLSGVLSWDPTYASLPYDPTKAKALLTQAGYPNGFTTTYLVGNWGDSGDSIVGQAIQQDLAQIGVNVTIRTASSATAGSLTNQPHTIPLFTEWWGPDFPNLTRRASLREPEPLEPGQVYEARIELDCCAWIFSAGRRMRVAIAGSDWPNVWPAPDPCVHTVWRGAGRPSRVELPLAPAATLPPTEFGAPITLPPLQTTPSGRGVFQFIHDYDEQTVTVHGDSGVSATTAHNPAVELLRATTWTLTASRIDPARVALTGTLMYALRDRDRETRAEGMIDMTSDRGSFHIVITLSVTINGTPYVQRSWTRTIPRQLL